MQDVTPEFRMSFPNLFEPRFNDLSKKNEFSVVALFPKGTDLSGLEKLMVAACEKKWGPNKDKWPKGLRSPIRDQSERIEAAKSNDKPSPEGYEEGAKFLNLRSVNRPGVVDQNVKPIIDPGQIYPGCWGTAYISVYAYDQAGNRGVGFGLQHVQKTRDGDPLGGRVRVEDAFKAVEGADEVSSSSDASSIFS